MLGGGRQGEAPGIYGRTFTLRFLLRTNTHRQPPPPPTPGTSGARGSPGGLRPGAVRGGAWASLLRRGVGAGSSARGARGSLPPPGAVPPQVPGGGRAVTLDPGGGGGPCVPGNLISPPPGPGSSSSRRGARARHSLRAPRLGSRPPPTPPAPANASPPPLPPPPPITATTDAFASIYSSHRGRRSPRSPPASTSPSLPARSAAAVARSLSLSLALSLALPQVSYLLRSGQREENTRFCLLFQVRSHTSVPAGTPSHLPLPPVHALSPPPHSPMLPETQEVQVASSSPAHLKK